MGKKRWVLVVCGFLFDLVWFVFFPILVCDHLSSFWLWCPFIPKLLKTIGFFQLCTRDVLKKMCECSYINATSSKSCPFFSSAICSRDVLTFQAQNEISFPCYFSLGKRLILYLRSSYCKDIPSDVIEET